MATYRCPKCGKRVTMRDRGKRPRQWCDAAGRQVRLTRIDRTVREAVEAASKGDHTCRTKTEL